jgi:hypothetical protein
LIPISFALPLTVILLFNSQITKEMKKFYTLVFTALSVCSSQFIQAQNGPNLLGAKGTFSAPFITANSSADSCTSSGLTTYSPVGNIGNALTGCSAASGTSLPCSGYPYTDSSNGLQPEYRYTIIKNIGDVNGGNCIKGDWRGQDHTGDGGYFMAVNGAPNTSYSNIFYQIKNMPVCPGTQYEFSAWVLNILPKSSHSAVAGSEPNISFKVITADGSQIIGNSGPITYTDQPTWVKVGGTFTASPTTTSVELQVINSTFVKGGNDLGLDDISFSVVQSNIAVNGLAGSNCEGNSLSVNFTVTDITHTNTWYKWQKSIDGGATFIDSSLGAQQAVYSADTFMLPLAFTNVKASMNGYKYRLAVSTSEEGLSNPGCTYFNEYTLLVNSCLNLPVILKSFTGKYSNEVATLNWQTSQEINTDHFELLKSADGKDFSLVTKVKSAGFSSLVKNYSYEDNSANNGQYVYYRLKQVDADGKFTFSSIIKLALGLNTSVVVYPNPFTSDFTVSFSATKTAPATLKLQSSTGQLIFLKTITVNKGNNSILVNNLPSLRTGIYYMSIGNEELNFNSKLQKL